MTPDELYITLGRIIEAEPNLAAPVLDEETRRWLQRACAMVRVVGNSTDNKDSLAVANKLSISGGDNALERHFMDILYRAHYTAELKAPNAVQGEFVATGKSFDAMMAVGKIIDPANDSIRIIDPYMDETALMEFAVLAKEQIAIELLSDREYVKPSLEPAVIRFTHQHGPERPVIAKISPPKTLHDRLIIVDGVKVFSLTQSLKDFAARSPASIIPVHGDIAMLKIDAYDGFWRAATPF
jgi:hypothetical protein